jgi:transcriptional regulator GlxA family with amidase domain
MLLAGQLLIQGTVSIETVARRLGHNSAASFSRASSE